VTRQRLGRLVATAALAGLALPSPAQAAGGALRIRDVDTSAFPTVKVTVTAPGATQAPAFAVTENGQPAPGYSLASPTAAMAIGLAIDTSQSMAGQPLHDAITAATSFAEKRRAGDLLGVYGFGATAYVGSPLSPDRTGAETAIEQLGTGPEQGTAIYAAVELAAKDLAGASAEKRILVLMTDGASYHDSSTLARAIAAARAANVTIYPVGIKSNAVEQGSLATLARKTGGRLVFARDSGALGAAYESIAAELGGTYAFSYRSLAPKGAPLRLSVAAPGFRTSTISRKAPGHSAPAGPASGGTEGPLPAGGAGRALVAGLAALFVLLGAIVLMTARPAVVVAKRIAPFTNLKRKEVVAVTGEEAPRLSMLHQLYVATEKIAGSFNYWQKTSFRLEQADLPLRTAEVVYIQIGGALLLALLAAAVLGVRGIVSVIPMALGVALPAFYVRFKAKRRLVAFENQLPETLITLAASLKAGHAFNAAIQSIVNEGVEPTAKEFHRVVSETQLGMPAEQALEAMAKRMESYNFGFVVMAVNIQRTVGGSLAEILDMVADTVRQRQQFGRKVKALTAQGRMSAYVLLAMPFLMALAIYAMNPSYMRILFTSSMGKAMIFGALVMMGIGSAVIRKIVSFKG
jgi:tight adherence protein B